MRMSMPYSSVTELDVVEGYTANELASVVSMLTGDFAEAVRDQFVTERQEHFAELEQRLLDETRQQPDCTRDNLAAALLKMNPNLSEQQASFLYPAHSATPIATARSMPL